MNLEYELENTGLHVYDVVISVPLPSGSYPTVTSTSEKWAVNPSTHSLDWTIPEISAESTTGSLEFNVGGDDPEAFFPVKANFVGSGSIAKVLVSGCLDMLFPFSFTFQIDDARQAANDNEVAFSQDRTFYVGEFTIS